MPLPLAITVGNGKGQAKAPHSPHEEVRRRYSWINRLRSEDKLDEVRRLWTAALRYVAAKRPMVVVIEQVPAMADFASHFREVCEEIESVPGYLVDGPTEYTVNQHGGAEDGGGPRARLFWRMVRSDAWVGLNLLAEDGSTRMAWLPSPRGSPVVGEAGPGPWAPPRKKRRQRQ